MDTYIKKEQIEIIDASQWYAESGKFAADKMLGYMLRKENEAVRRGFDGLRVAVNNPWGWKRDWTSFAVQESAIDSTVSGHRMVVICSYPLDKCGIPEVIEVIGSHQFALAKLEGK